MNETQIGIKLADGSFYPVLDEGQAGRKRLILTTVRDNQDTVQIDLYRGKVQRAEQADFVGSLTIEGIAAAPQREPEIELVVGVDESGTLEAEATDARSGERQTLSVSLSSAQSGSPQFELEGEGAVGAAAGATDPLLTGETYPVSAADRRKEHLHKAPGKRRPALLICLLLLSLILIAAIAFVAYRALTGRPILPPVGQAAVAAAAPAQPAPSPAAVPAQPTPAPTPAPAPAPTPAAAAVPAQPVPPAAATAAASGQQGPPPTAATTKSDTGGIWYGIKWGDTLWDIAGTYYRNPWLYPKIAKANRITNPDLIFAGRQLFIPEN